MIKISVAVNAIVAGETICAEGLDVQIGIDGAGLAMTFGANARVETGNCLGVAVATDEGNAIDANFMPGQGEAGHLMGKVCGIHNGQRGRSPEMFRVARLAGR